MLPIKIELPENFLEEEIRNGYTISAEMKKVWAVELDLLAEFGRVCQEHQIEFWGVGGTTLGAVRHGGFIPWDDDIDLMMTRENYNKLCACSPNAFSAPYFFQTDVTDPGSMRGHAQLRNSKTTGILKNEFEKQLPINQGIFIDIFPLDHLPDDTMQREKHLNKLRKQRKKMHTVAAWTGYYPRQANKRSIAALRRFVVPFGRLLDRMFHINRTLEREYEKLSTMYNGKNMKQAGIMPFALITDHVIWDRSDCEKGTVFVDYEFMKMPLPVRHTKLLDQQYGNWKQFVVNGSQHGEVIFDPETPYVEYLSKLKGASVKTNHK